MTHSCNCRNVCGDDPALTKGDAEPCANRRVIHSDDMNDRVLAGLATLDAQQASDLLEEMDALPTMPITIDGKMHTLPTEVTMHIVRLRMLLERAVGSPIQWR